MKSALSSKVAADEMIVVDDFSMDAIKTKEMANILSAVKAGKRLLSFSPKRTMFFTRAPATLRAPTFLL